MRKAFAGKLLDRARIDPRIILITGDLGFGVLDEFAQELPNQFINAGINEQSAMSISAGMASEGYRPFYYSIANFPTFRCLEQIRVDVNYMNNPVTIVAVGAGYAYGSHGYTHHAVEDLAIIRSLQNFQIYSPTFAEDIDFSLDSILAGGSPSYLRLGVEVSDEVRASIDKHSQQGEDHDVLICFTGSIANHALDLSREIELMGLKCRIQKVTRLNHQNILQIIQSAGLVSKVVVLEEHYLVSGLGSMFLETANSALSELQILRIGIENPIQHVAGSREELLNLSGFSIEKALQVLRAQ